VSSIIFIAILLCKFYIVKWIIVSTSGEEKEGKNKCFLYTQGGEEKEVAMNSSRKYINRSINDFLDIKSQPHLSSDL
jgi:hypothetical protein